MKRSNFFGGRRALLGAATIAMFAVAACDGDPAAPFDVVGQGDIQGFLYFDEDRDGTFEPAQGDSVLSGVDLYMVERETDHVIPGTQATTDDAGRFSISDVKVGTHSLVVDLPESVGIVCQNPVPVSVRIREVTNVEVTGQESCLITIAAAREQPIDEPVTVRGVVTAGSGTISSSYFWIQDETAGIKIFMPFAAAAGQVVEVSGLIEVYSGEIEISRGSVTVLGTTEIPDPIVITGEQLVSHEFQGSLVTVEGVTVTEIGTGDSYNVTVEAPDGSSFVVRVDEDAGITPGIFSVGGVYDVSGVVGPFGGSEQLYIRSDADVVPVQ